MSETKLTKTRIRAGVWEGVLSGVKDTQPLIEVRLHEQIIENVELAALPGKAETFLLRVPVPAEVLNDGVQTFLIFDKTSGEKLQHFTIITGAALEDDLRAEVDLLRAELDMLKRAFRRHCLETAS